jgi:SpoVK/Ycf46/Vps4 family AAA+-type ATPase
LDSKDWVESNQKYLAACVASIKSQLKEKINPAENTGLTEVSKLPIWTLETPAAIDSLCGLFGLSQFEKSILLLCAAVELDSETAQLCASANGNSSSPYPTFGLAMALFEDAHWSALTPASPLRRFKLVETLDSQSLTLKDSPLRINERVLHYITGISYLEPRLNGILRPVSDNSELLDSHRSIVEKILLLWQNGEHKMPLVQLWGTEESTKLAVAKNACSRLGLNLWQMDGEFIPSKYDEIETLTKFWCREAALLESGLYISAEEVEPATQKVIRRLIEEIPGPVFIGVREPWISMKLQTISLQIKKPKKAEQQKLWSTVLALGLLEPDQKEISKITGQFDLSAESIQESSITAFKLSKNSSEIYKILWDTCRTVSRPRLSELTQEIIPIARMNDLVLPEKEKRLLNEIAIHVAQRSKVYGEWGFEAKSSRGLGITVLFSGSSGTGKTMAADVLANELQLDLFRIDLSSVVSKYIGETEKNLRRVFDAAEGGGAILFFDEADALFGKRSEVKDSHDRYANIEISYLLQRMENYSGLAILSTNMKKALDPAFTRRIRFMVEFPFPDQKSREEIWKHIFPTNTPTNNLNLKHLANLNITGGNIHNMALYASFLAANEGVPVNMSHLKRAAQVEFDKLERPLIQSEIEGW